MARLYLFLLLTVVGFLAHIDCANVNKRLLNSDPNYLHNIEVKMQDMTQTIAGLTQKYGDLEAQLRRQNTTIAMFQAGNQSNIFFDAYLSKRIGNFGIHHTIIFDGTVSNQGNRYNTATGIFTCDRPGVYVFFCRLLVSAAIPLYTEVVKNGISIGAMFSHDADTFGHSATMVVNHLQPGDTVWVRTASFQSHSLSGTILDNWESTFAGFLLHADY